LDSAVADHPAHRRIAAQPLGVIHVLRAGEASEDGLPQQADQDVAAVLAGAPIGKHVTGHVGQADCVV
jgi:hypothetical protein